MGSSSQPCQKLIADIRDVAALHSEGGRGEQALGGMGTTGEPQFRDDTDPPFAERALVDLRQDDAAG
jgi:hypothetical protein